MRVATVLIALAAIAVAGCGGSGGTTTSSSPIRLSQRVLNESELPSDYDVRRLVTLTSTTDVVKDFDPIFLPKTFERRLDAAGFVRTALETIEGPTKPSKTQAGAGGNSYAALFGSHGGAAAQLTFLRQRALAPCITACEVSRESFDVPDIPGAVGVERYQTENTPNGPAFELYYVFFAAGPYLYAEALSGPPDGISKSDIVDASQSLYDRVTR